jgi:NAD(P)-dependent dehydrogenase (short-subunit alcohol dehydrogenase family)
MTIKDKTVLITGATSGIGKATAISLASQGATIVLACRDLGKGKQAVADIADASGSSTLEALQCDLSSFSSIRAFCDEYRSKFTALHVLINNAGAWDFKRRESKDGIENIFAVNFLAPFLLTNLLLGLLKESSPSRIVNVSSGLHGGTINFDDPEGKKKFSSLVAYRQSKLALLLFTRLLAKKLEGSGVTVNAVHPGFVSTNLGRDAGFFARYFFTLLGKSPEKGAQTSIYVATSPDLEVTTGQYFANCAPAKASKQSCDLAAAERLWQVAAAYVHL